MLQFRVHEDPSICLQRSPTPAATGPRPAVLFVHGATFPTALASGYRFDDGTSWVGTTAAAGFDVWALDFAGYGASERYAGINTEGAHVLVAAWHDDDRAAEFCHHHRSPSVRSLQVRVIREYGMHDRREAPQYYRDIRETGTDDDA